MPGCSPGLELGGSVTFCLGSAGERLAVVPAAVCHDSSGQVPSSALSVLNQAPDRVQGAADLQGERSPLSAAAGGESPAFQPTQCPGKRWGPRVGWQELRKLVGASGKQISAAQEEICAPGLAGG